MSVQQPEVPTDEARRNNTVVVLCELWAYRGYVYRAIPIADFQTDGFSVDWSRRTWQVTGNIPGGKPFTTGFAVGDADSEPQPLSATKSVLGVFDLGDIKQINAMLKAVGRLGNELSARECRRLP